MENTIYIITHKDDVLINDNNLYKTLWVGENKLNNNALIDNTGDNISYKNKNYCELTGLYWIWKNNIFSKNIGICHYRRFFDISNIRISEILKNDDFIIPTPIFLGINIKQQYINCHIDSDWQLMLSVLKEKYSDYYESSKIIFNNNRLYGYNMFITSQEQLNKYCEWLFDILFEIEKRNTRILNDTYQNRYFGFLSERLFTLYLLHNKLKIHEINIVSQENK